jgi:hypothetical protein
MATFGTLVGGLIGGFGKKPKIPKLPTIDPSQVQGDAITGNQAAMPGLTKLGGEVNEFNTQQRLGWLSKALEFAAGPGALGQVQNINASQLRGEISPDISASVMRSTAGKAFAGGFGGSGMASNMGLRDLGLTSMGIQQQGLANLQSFAGMAAKGAACWVARAVYGVNNPKWKIFRLWLFTEAPAVIREFYLKHGENMARALRHNEPMRRTLRRHMDTIIKNFPSKAYAW